MLDDVKERVCEANLSLVRHGLIKLTWGNASEIDAAREHVVIKPSGVPYEGMRPEHMVVLTLAGEVVEGDYRPSSDTPTHLALYRAWACAGGVVHTHSPCATSFAQACRALPCLGTTHADTFYGGVPVTRPLTSPEVADAYEANTGAVIAETFADGQIDPRAVPAALVANHGPFTWGADAAEAVKHAAILEEVAKMAQMTLQLAPEVPSLARHILEKHYTRKHGPNAYYGQRQKPVQQ